MNANSTMSAAPVIEVSRHDVEAIPRAAKVLTVSLFGRWHFEVCLWVGFYR